MLNKVYFVILMMDLSILVLRNFFNSVKYYEININKHEYIQ